MLAQATSPTDIHASIDPLIQCHEHEALPRLARLWCYYRNPLREVSRDAQGRWYRLAQEVGLPARIVGRAGQSERRREVVVENDIAWRLHTMVDFLFGKPFSLQAAAAAGSRRQAIEGALNQVFEASGGASLWQDSALLAHIFGHVDYRVRSTPGDPSPCVIEMIDPRRGVALLDTTDYRKLRAYAIHVVAGETGAHSATARSTTILQPHSWTHLEDGRVVAHGLTPWTMGLLPIVHVQNTAQPLSYEGLGEVEPLIPLQDELNTRLSDRASRVTLQSFKMYLAKGLDGLSGVQVSPGQLWTTENVEAEIDEFGGDASSPSEERHIQEVREAMDKISGVPPLASGVVQSKVGNLSSANALKVTLMSLLSKTTRKQIAFGRAISDLCTLVLNALHHSGALRTDPSERRVQVTWPDPLPIDVREQMFAAEAKARLGVPRERVLAELGYLERSTS